MQRASVGAIREQIEADREFVEKLQEEQRTRIPTPIEILGDAKYAQRLHDEINDPAQLADELEGDVVASEIGSDEAATSSEDEE